MTLVLLVFLLFWRLYSSFLDFAYPELDASSKKSYSDVEGWDRNLKIFVPFFSTVTTVVYNKLVEVLKKDAKRFPWISLWHFSCPFPIFLLQCNYVRELKFQMQEDSEGAITLVAEGASLLGKPLSKKQLATREKRAQLAQIKSTHARSREHLHGGVFLNWQFLVPDMQLVMLDRLINFYPTKQQCINDAQFLYPMNVSRVWCSNCLFCCADLVTYSCFYLLSLASSSLYYIVGLVFWWGKISTAWSIT